MTYVDLLGTIAGTLTTFGAVPQVLKILKTKSTRDISLGMFATTDIGISLWLVYGLFIKAFPVILFNAISFILISIIVICKLKYK